MARKSSFQSWWDHIRIKPKAETDKWLYYASITVSRRGNQDEQTFVHAVHNRYQNSQYRMPKYMAKRVFDIINHKQIAHRQETRGVQYKRKPLPKGPVVIHRKTSTRKITGGILKKKGSQTD